MRTVAAKLTTLIAITIALSGVGSPDARARQAGSIDSGGLGLTRVAFEATYGPPQITESPLGPYDELSGYAFQQGWFYVAYEGSKTEAEDIAVYIEVSLGGDGVGEEQATGIVESLLPADATIEGASFAPPTPDGPIALRTMHYTSDALGSVPYGTTTLPPDFLVIYHQTLTDTTPSGAHQRTYETTVSRISFMTRLPEG